MKKILIAPSILSADFSRLGEEVQAVTNAGCDWIHVDVMDGHFVPNITIGPCVVRSLRNTTKLPLDVHLMITDPIKYVPDFVSAGADSITFHQEVTKDLKKTVQLIRAHKVKVGVSINPDTPVETIQDILPEIDLVLVMTVFPGFGGQKFIESCVDKVKDLNRIREQKKLQFLIEADGGINESTAKDIVKVGCDVLVAGSFIFGKKDYSKAISEIRSAL